MKPEFKIKETIDGKFEVYYVENKKLKPFVTYSGSDRIFAFSKLKLAIEELKSEILKNTTYGKQ